MFLALAISATDFPALSSAFNSASVMLKTFATAASGDGRSAFAADGATAGSVIGSTAVLLTAASAAGVVSAA
ncbi:unannotated protein [freshwater metagenome]|uniref:Unannotated protein n=1 Tax=freshwater metagenome TaxID=449393 RepID=A0A6J6MVJ7_9ZZZZ